jgi:ADP-ribose pyrophosphatase
VTAPRATLPEFPKVEVETLSEAVLGEGGFLALRRSTLALVRDGERTPSFQYDVVDRPALDAAVVVAHHRQDGGVWVWLRSCVRPPLSLRRAPAASALLWEVPAGLVEPGESPGAAAVRELAEELGFRVREEATRLLGPPGFPAPGMIGERHHFFHVEVEPALREEPPGDGSHVEAGARIVCVPLAEALTACRRGELPDEKTELALRRLAEEIAEGPR